MPELPEIEILRRNLERWLVGRRIEGVEVFRESVFKDVGAQDIGAPTQAKLVVGSRVTGVSRRGKVLWMDTSGPVGWLMRFGMTGKWVAEEGTAGGKNGSTRQGTAGGKEGSPEPADGRPRWARVQVLAEGGRILYLVDPRCFGGIWVLPGEEGPAALRARVPGIDPLLEGLSGADLQRRFAGRRVAVKVLLLDQASVAGVGNIYASEALYRAGISPLALAGELSAEACERLADAIVFLLKWAIEVYQSDEVRYFGESGAENRFQVYQRAREPCGRCSTLIQRVVVGGRSTFFCPSCQGGAS